MNQRPPLPDARITAAVVAATTPPEIQIDTTLFSDGQPAFTGQKYVGLGRDSNGQASPMAGGLLAETLTLLAVAHARRRLL